MHPGRPSRLRRRARPGALLLVVAALFAVTACESTTGASAIKTKVAAPPLVPSFAADQGAVTAFPVPDSRTALPASQLSFAGATASSLASLRVTGSRSGSHTGKVENWSTGDGASFVPTTLFTSGETVTVATGLSVTGATSGTYSFAVATPGTETTPPPGISSPTYTAATTSFLTEPSIHAPVVTVTHPSTGSDFDVLLGTKGDDLPNAVQIVDNTGQLVYYRPLSDTTSVNDVSDQTYRGKPVLTWWQGQQNTHGYGAGEGVIVNSHYQTVATVHAGNGLNADLHEFQLLPDGSALVTAYSMIRWDTRSVGGVANGLVLDAIAQRIDVKTGLVEWQWDALDHVPLSASQTKPPTTTTTAWDYFHINSIQLTPQSTILVSGRNTSAFYNLDAAGDVEWVLGGSRSSFTMPTGSVFTFQHDGQLHDNDVLTLFDDGGGPPRSESQSRALTLALDPTTHTVTVLHSFTHTPAIVAQSQGDTQLLANGDELVGWGSQPNVTEFSPTGAVDWDAQLPQGISSYRAYSAEWTGAPTTKPAVAVSGSSLAVSWNGDTRTARWRVLAGSSAAHLSAVATATRSGFETAVTLPRSYADVRVQALTANGHVLGTSAVASG